MASANAENNPFRLDYLFYLVNEADNTAAVVRPPQQYDYIYSVVFDGVCSINSPTNHERIYDLRGMEKKAGKGIYIKGGKLRIKN